MTARPTSRLTVELPSWAQVSRGRLKHIVRVTTLLADWSTEMGLSPSERQTWIDAGRFHDSLRDAPVDELRALAGSSMAEVELLHGPAAAVRLAADGESRQSLLDAVRYHSIGSKDWDPVGRALYMADYLEPGRTFDSQRRAELARLVPRDFDGAFKQVVATRMDYARQHGYTEYPESIALLESLR